jgi:long-chain acyl-CoA synthetase
MVGYHRLPEDTKSFRDPDGWMHSGDIGHIDPDGYLFITDRKKSLIVLSNGKKVAPTPIESRIASNPLAAQVVVIGEGRNYLTALIAPNRELAAARGFDDAAIERELQTAIDEVNRDLPSFETIKRFAVLPRPLTEADGDLTPTLKVKRSEVARNFATLIDRLYADPAAAARKTGS